MVTCSNCGAANGPGVKFCGECGRTLAVVSVPRAGPTTMVPAAGDSAAPAGAPLAERRLISVLFVDLVGFTTFAEGRDAEDVRETLTRYFELASNIIGRYGGTVEKFIGDAVMAVWGAPIAHEDDAERAVRSALEQTARPQVLVIDDGSNDGTAEMLRTEFPQVVVHRGDASQPRAW